MLQIIRSKATSFAAKVLFGILIIAFGAGIWSNAGYMFRSRLGDTSVAHVGSRMIEPNELQKEVRDMSNELNQRFKGTLTPEQLKTLGVVDAALQRLVNQDLLELEIERLQLAVGDSQLSQIIRSVPAFRDKRGVFDPAIYHALVSEKHMSPQQYESELRNEVVESQLDQALIAGVSPPPELVDTLYRSSAERRTADMMTIPESAVPAPATPSDADIEAYYEKHTKQAKDEDQQEQDREAAALNVPELRSFSVGLLLVEDVAAQIKVPEEKLRSQYDQRQDEFRTKAEGHFEQIVLPDEAKAKEAEAELAQGKDFAEVAADVAHQAKDKIDIGTFKKGELLPQLNDPAFALKAGETTQPIQTTFGWHILHAVEMKPETVRPFDEVKEKLAKDVA
ncbi:MAG TPA: SurA N-terminal domain-containing protein, partial [Stellaceae bacterium]|nr:SurA N-terminal domain-containing protein [Stellaceae bacterium]